jgi:hypothetical protein
LSYGRDWALHIETHISPLTLYGVKGQIKKYTRMANGVRWLKTNTVAHIDVFISSLGTVKHR